MSATLRELQEWLEGAMTAPPDAENAKGDVELRMTASPRLSALERVEIYHRSYWSRLVEVLGDDFPTVRYAMGDDAFTALAHEYIARFPSTGPNLNAYSRHLPAMLEARGEAFLSELATLEWAVIEVVHAKASPKLTLDAIRSIPPERLGDMVFSPGNAVRILEFAYPTNVYFQAHKDDEAPAIPEAKPSCAAVYRHETTVWRWDMTPAMAMVLARLFRGETLGVALAALQGDADMLQEALSRLQLWFQEWVSRGFFAAVSTS